SAPASANAGWAARRLRCQSGPRVPTLARTAPPTRSGPSGLMASRRLSVDGQTQSAGKYQSLYLARPLSDLEHLGVPVEPADGCLVHVPVAPEDLGGLAGGGHRRLGRIQLGHGRRLLE